MKDKNEFMNKSKKLIENVEEQNRILNNLYEKMNIEYQQKFVSKNDDESDNVKNIDTKIS